MTRHLLSRAAVAALAILTAACGDHTNVSEPTRGLRAQGTSFDAAPAGKGLVSGVPVTCDNNSTLTVTIVRGGPPGVGPAWFDDGTHTVSQSVTLAFDGQVIYQASWGNKNSKLPTVVCQGPFPVGDDFGWITVSSVIQP